MGTAPTREARRIVLVMALMDTRSVSGPGRQLAALVKPLREHGVELRPAVIRRKAWRTHPYTDYLDALEIGHDVLTDVAPLDPTPALQFVRLVRKLRPAIVQTHGYRPTALVCLVSRFPRAWRWVGFHHGRTSENWRVRAYSSLDLALLPFADRIVVVAESQRELLRGSQGKLDVISNAVLPAGDGLFDSSASSVASHITEYPTPRLGFVGRISPEKGLDILLRAFQELVERGTAGSLIVAGDGPERQAMVALAAELGLASRVAFLGQVTNVHEVYRNVAAVVLPSRSEGLPNTLLEALAEGVPVVATAVGGVPQVLVDPMAGLMVQPHDQGSLSRAIDSVLTGHGTPAHAEARARAVARYSLERRVEEHLRIYRSVTRT